MTKKLEQILEGIELSTDPTANIFQIQRLGGLSESTFDDEKRQVQVTVLKAGWSHNGIYYPQVVLEQISNFLNTTAKKVYMDHNKDGVKANRKVSEWVATVESAKVVGNEVKALITVHEEGPDAWVYNRMKKVPSEFGPSIVGLAEVAKGTAEGISGRIAKSIRYIRSFDIVTDPAAGGTIDGVVEQTGFSDILDDYKEVELISESISDAIVEQTLADYMKRVKEREKVYKLREELWKILNALDNITFDLVLAKDDFQYASISDRKKLLTAALEDVGKKLLAIEFITPLPKDSVATKEGKQVIVSESKEVEITETRKVSTMTIEEIKRDNPGLYSQIVAEVTESLESNEHLTGLEESKKTLTTKVETLEEQVNTLDADKVKLTTEVKELKESLAVYEKTATEVARDKVIDEVIKESKLAEHAVTDVFTATLKSVPYDSEKLEEHKKAVSALVEDRKVMASGKSKGVVSTGSVKVPDTPVSEENENSYPVDNAKAMSMING
jgi:hypothetical protein